jgi:hypothetical protein
MWVPRSRLKVPKPAFAKELCIEKYRALKHILKSGKSFSFDCLSMGSIGQSPKGKKVSATPNPHQEFKIYAVFFIINVVFSGCNHQTVRFMKFSKL